jgi:hypothetical protein
MRVSKLAARGLVLLAIGPLGSPAAARAQGLGLDLRDDPPPPSKAPKKEEEKKPAEPAPDVGKSPKNAAPPLELGLDLTDEGAKPEPKVSEPAPAKEPEVSAPAAPNAGAEESAAPDVSAPAPEDGQEASPPAEAEAVSEPAPAPPEYFEETEFEPNEPRRRSEPIAFVVAGPGAVFRNLSAGAASNLLPEWPGAMAGLGLDVSFFPARLDSRQAHGALSDFALEGHYRRTFARAQFRGAKGEETPCEVDDDEIVARLVYRYPLRGERLPRVGLSAGWSSERILVRCDAPALSTRLRTLELHLTALEPILGENLQVQASGGPRFVISPHSAQAPARAFSLELWLASHPMSWFYGRAGVRYTDAREQTEQGIDLSEQRAFAGIELGASF